MNLPDNSASWDEFQWEKEFRKDDHRIAGYYRALAGCLDLPDEDEIVKGRMAQAEPVFASSFFGREQHQNMDEDNGDDDNSQAVQDTDWRFRPGAEACRRVADMVSSWNRLASSFPPGQMAGVLATTCRFGVLLERVYALSDCGDSPVALRISMVKRILASLNELIGCLNDWCSIIHKGSRELTDIIMQIQFFREAAVDSLAALRKENIDS